jgi:hypothetical protein
MACTVCVIQSRIETMNPSENTFREVAFVKVRLLREPLYRLEDPSLWATLRSNLEEVRSFFRQIGQEVIFDESEGYAFIRQIEPNEQDAEKIPRLIQKRPLNYETTLLLVFLREELDRFESSGTDSTRLVRSRDQLRLLVTPYLRDSTDQARERNRLDEAINRLVKLGFLRSQGGEEIEEFQVMRIVKARFGPGELESIKERLLRYAQARS